MKTNSIFRRVWTVLGAALFASLSVQAVTTADYAKHFTITVPADLGEQTFENFPVLVRLSTSIVGFDYADFKVDGGGDLIFTDEGGTILSHEIDTWDTTGTSLVWVKAPSLTGGTVLHCYYAGPDASSAVTSTDTWSDYAGVWHFNETGATSFDSTAHNLDADNTDSSSLAGLFGNARKTTSDTSGSHPAGRPILIPDYSDQKLGGSFSVSIWMNHDAGGFYYDYILMRASGFAVKFNNNGSNTQLQLGKNLAKATVWPASIDKQTWAKMVVNFEGTTATVYTNGVFCQSYRIWAACTDSSDILCVGAPNTAMKTAQSSVYNGRLDEFRMRAGALSSEWVAAEYAIETHPELLTYSAVADATTKLSLIIASNLEGVGTPNPAYGAYNVGEEPAFITSCTNFFLDNVCYSCLKYTTETSSDNGISWSEPVEHVGSDMDFTYAGTAVRVTWIWAPYARPATIGANRSSASIAFSSAPYVVDESGARYFPIGSTVTATATDEAALGCRMWLLSDGTTVSGDELSFTVGETPVSAMAVLSYPWAYVTTTDEAGKTVRKMTDGEWIFRSDLQTNGFGLKELLQAAPSGVLVIPSSCTNDSRGVTLLANQLFKNSTALKVLILPETELALEGGTFSGCTSLERIEPFLPATVTFTGNAGYCFNGCTSLTGDLRLVNPNQSVFPAARNFQRTNIKSVYAPYLTRILDYDFHECSSLTNVVLGEKLIRIGASSFANDPALVSVTPFLPDTLTSIGNAAFENSPALKGDLKLKALEIISEKSFNGTALTSVEAPAATNVQKYAFVAASTLQRITFGAEGVDFNSYQPVSMKTLGEIYLPGKAPTSTFGPAAFGWSSYKTIVYCDPVVDPAGWASFMTDPTRFRVVEDSEKTVKNNYPGPKTLGLILTTDNRVYWLVKYKSPLRKTGLMLLVR